MVGEMLEGGRGCLDFSMVRQKDVFTLFSHSLTQHVPPSYGCEHCAAVVRRRYSNTALHTHVLLKSVSFQCDPVSNVGFILNALVSVV